ncbi:enoyl-CoA hydratase-related protein [Lachnospiraceae bacterium ZAX-1]
MDYKTLQYRQQGGIATLTLNQPKAMNALSDLMLTELYKATDHIYRDDNVRAVILTGSGRAFCVGGDITRFAKGYTAENAYAYMDNIHTWVKAFTQMPKPTVAAVNGYATGAGLCLALFCDVILAAPDTKFGSAFLNVGIIPDLASLYYLPRLMGMHRAKEFIFAGEMISAQKAYDWGLLNRVTGKDSLLVEAEKLAGQMAGTSQFALRTAKRLLHEAMNTSRDELLSMEAYAQALCFQGKDFEEGICAFKEKRQPNFIG